MAVSKDLIDIIHEKKVGFDNASHDTILFSDMKNINYKKFPYAVTMKDDWFSGLSREFADKDTKFMHLCTSYEMAEAMKKFGRYEMNQKYINIVSTDSVSSSVWNNSLVVLKAPNDVPMWLKSFKENHEEEYNKAMELESPVNDIALYDLCHFPTVKELEKEGGNKELIELLKTSAKELDRNDFDAMFKACYQRKLNGSKYAPEPTEVAGLVLRPFSNSEEPVQLYATDKYFRTHIIKLANDVCFENNRKFETPAMKKAEEKERKVNIDFDYER